MNTEDTKLPPVVTLDSLKETHGEDALKTYHNVARAGGFGDFTDGDFTTGPPPLDISGLSDEIKIRVAQVLKTTSPAAPVAPPTPPVSSASPTFTNSDKKNEDK